MADLVVWLLHFPKVIGPQRRVLLVRVCMYLGMIHDNIPGNIPSWKTIAVPLGLKLGPGRYLSKLYPHYMTSEAAAGQLVMACCPWLGKAVVVQLEVMLKAEAEDKDQTAYEHRHALRHYEGVVRARYDPVWRGSLCVTEVEHTFCEILEHEGGNLKEHLSRAYAAPDRECCVHLVGCAKRCTMVSLDLRQARGKSARTLMASAWHSISSFAVEAAAHIGVDSSKLDGATQLLLAAVQEDRGEARENGLPSMEGSTSIAQVAGSCARALLTATLPQGAQGARLAKGAATREGDDLLLGCERSLVVVWIAVIQPLAQAELLEHQAVCAVLAMRLAITLLLLAFCRGKLERPLRHMARALVTRRVGAYARVALVLVHYWPLAPSLLVLPAVMELAALIASERMAPRLRRELLLAVTLSRWLLIGFGAIEVPSLSLGQVANECLHMMKRWCQLRGLRWASERCLLAALRGVYARQQRPHSHPCGSSRLIDAVVAYGECGVRFYIAGKLIVRAAPPPAALLRSAVLYVGSNYGHTSSYLWAATDASIPFPTVSRALPIICPRPRHGILPLCLPYLPTSLACEAKPPIQKVTTIPEATGWPLTAPLSRDVVEYVRSAAMMAALVGAPPDYEYVPCSEHSKAMTAIVESVCGDAVAVPAACFVVCAAPHTIDTLLVGFCGGGMYAIGACLASLPETVVGVDIDAAKLANFAHNLTSYAGLVVALQQCVPSTLAGLHALLPDAVRCWWHGWSGIHVQLSPPCQPCRSLRPEKAALKVQLSVWLRLLHQVWEQGGSGCLEESDRLIGPARRVVQSEGLRVYLYHCHAHLPPVNLLSSRSRLFATTYLLPSCAAFELIA